MFPNLSGNGTRFRRLRQEVDGLGDESGGIKAMSGTYDLNYVRRMSLPPAAAIKVIREHA